jgi:hypothetical protein
VGRYHLRATLEIGACSTGLAHSYASLVCLYVEDIHRFEGFFTFPLAATDEVFRFPVNGSTKAATAGGRQYGFG